MSADIAIVYGDTRHYTLNITDSADQPVDLDVGTVVVSVKERLDDAEVFLEKSIGDGIEVNDEGVAVLELTGDDLALLDNDWQTLPWEARYFDEDGEPISALRGVIRVCPSVGSNVAPEES